MIDPRTTLSRRALLKRLGAAGMAAPLTASLGQFGARAATTDGYRALVCIFMLGGLDGHDVLIPYDQAEYDEYASIRSALIGQYAAGGISSRARGALLPLTLGNAGQFPGRAFALAPELSGVHTLFEQGNAAVVGNVGPLIAPLSRKTYQSGSVPQPKRLFSHNDQQSTWMASAPEGAQFGWGGRFADAMLAAGANTGATFTAMATQNTDLYLTGQQAAPYQLGLGGETNIRLLNQLSWMQENAARQAAYASLQAHFEAGTHASASLIEQDVAAAIQHSFANNALYNEARETLVPLATQFPISQLGSQLQAIAETISLRSTLGVGRQIFFAAFGGFDTHDQQAEDLPALLQDLDASLSAFYQATAELGVENSVTTFTGSDFGRTLSINGDGTDHGWGNHAIVMGGDLDGGKLFGRVPQIGFDHDRDAGRGRLIPDVSVESFAAPLGSWFGLNNTELAAALPNLASFGGGEPALFGSSV